MSDIPLPKGHPDNNSEISDDAKKILRSLGIDPGKLEFRSATQPQFTPEENGVEKPFMLDQVTKRFSHDGKDLTITQPLTGSAKTRLRVYVNDFGSYGDVSVDLDKDAKGQKSLETSMYKGDTEQYIVSNLSARPIKTVEAGTQAAKFPGHAYEQAGLVYPDDGGGGGPRIIPVERTSRKLHDSIAQSLTGQLPGNAPKPGGPK